MSLHDVATKVMHAFDPETTHGLALKAMELGLGPVARPADPILKTTVGGLALPNAIGLAAGFDKDARVPGGLLRAGFGFVELGGVTPRPQPGNPKPRLFRLTEDGAVINRMGFNNQGLDAFAERLARPRRAGVVGVNLGANKDAEDRTADYVTGLKRLWGLADYFAVNVSSPNTPGLRQLQSKDALDDLLGRVAEARAGLDGPRAPIFLKVAPDLDAAADVPVMVDACVRHGIDGIIVSNTTIERPASLTSSHRAETGGLSGKPLFEPSTAMLKRFAEVAPEGLDLVGVGGVSSGADAYAKIKAGARAIQLYSALVLQGPGLIGRIGADLAARLRADGFTSIGDAVGTG